MIKSCENPLNYVHKIRKKRLFSGFILIVIAASIAAISINDYGTVFASHEEEHRADQGDVFPPSFTTSFAEDEYPLTIDGKTFKMSDLATKVDTVIVETAKSIQVKVLVFDETHSSEIQNVDLLTNLRGSSRTASDSDTRIHFQTGNPPTVVDPHGYFANVDVTSSEKGNKLEVIFDITFAKEMDTSDIIITAKDRSNNNSSKDDVLQWYMQALPNRLDLFLL